MEFNLFTERSSASTICPNCGTAGRMSRMKPDSDTGKILYKILKMRKYHCNDCKYNGIFFNYRLRKNAGRILFNNFIFLAAGIIISIISYYIIKHYF